MHRLFSLRHVLMFGVILANCGGFSSCAEAGKEDPKFPFRTDFANENFPWYQLKPLEFPPHHSDHRVGGELVGADFIHRTGTFRNKAGELINFKLAQFGYVTYLNTEADLRDVPLGTYFLFFLHQDGHGAFTQLATMQDQFSMDAGHGFAYKLDEIKLAENKLLVTKHSVSNKEPDLGKSELIVSELTHVWKNGKAIKLSDLAVGDELLFNRTGMRAGHPSRCTEIWVGADSHKLAIDTERKVHHQFLRDRGLPAWIEHVDGKKLTVTIFGERESIQALFKEDNIVPAQWAKEHRQIKTAVADFDLRTYEPQVDKEGTTWLEVLKAPTDVYGCSGERWVIEPNLMLEGFRKGHIVRLFVGPSWKVESMPIGENVYYDAVSPETREISLNQYPYRTDYGNYEMPWYTLKPTEFPPLLSEHRVYGTLLSVAENQRGGQMRPDGEKAAVNFTITPLGSVMALKADAELSDLAIGSRSLFYLYQDDKGAFTKAALVTDEFSYLAANNLTHRIVSLKLSEGKIDLARHLPQAKNYNGDPIQPPDLGDTEIAVDDKTVVWKGDKAATLKDLVVGDEVLLNFSGRGDPGSNLVDAIGQDKCCEIWAGTETISHATEQQRKKRLAYILEHGAAAMVDGVDGKKITVIFKTGLRSDLIAPVDGDPKKKIVYVATADSSMKAVATPEKMTVLTRLPDIATAGTIGSSGVRWELEMTATPNAYTVGQILLIFKDSKAK